MRRFSHVAPAKVNAMNNALGTSSSRTVGQRSTIICAFAKKIRKMIANMASMDAEENTGARRAGPPGAGVLLGVHARHVRDHLPDLLREGADDRGPLAHSPAAAGTQRVVHGVDFGRGDVAEPPHGPDLRRAHGGGVRLRR